MKYLPLILLLLAGCAPTVVNRDFEKEKTDYIKKYGLKATDPLWQAPSNKVGIAGQKDDVMVVAYRDNDIHDGGMELQQWKVFVKNNNDEPKCVQTFWQTQDFEMYTSYPDFLKIAPKTTVQNYARLTQQIWLLDGIKMALPPSAYVARLVVEDPNDKGTCDFANQKVEDK